MVGKVVHIIRGAWKGHTGTITQVTTARAHVALPWKEQTVAVWKADLAWAQGRGARAAPAASGDAGGAA